MKKTSQLGALAMRYNDCHFSHKKLRLGCTHPLSNGFTTQYSVIYCSIRKIIVLYTHIHMLAQRGTVEASDNWFDLHFLLLTPNFKSNFLEAILIAALLLCFVLLLLNLQPFSTICKQVTFAFLWSRLIVKEMLICQSVIPIKRIEL